ncbi:hypothetical protein L249_2424 [Ophiocordyceps polyrhachis-furcata BCC 54312]|uniref:D-xylose 1-dehydrogenase (NADP(+), D-xylono-1,5-lactone-forming) n=1 Tax=Ophiocordyceps polyrhachis-furcata BCC 54312 TaxID=1330021 RepID=A0A367LSR1_9HYPO|nr:hypothetical protein L249_2424 [Ophiocordyceps polyrhachis-furcata BCC 54312]
MIFCKDLLTDPSSRDVSDVRHELVAVASSTSTSRATSFINGLDGADKAKPYGSYAELVSDPDVDMVYVATPHSHHFQNVMLALRAGKNVLCEKALTVNGSQARLLVETARARNLFFMEAVWTRFFPLTDVSILDTAESQDGTLAVADSHRLVNKDLAGGALLDVGVYALTWVFQTLYHVQPEEEDAGKELPVVMAASNQYRTGVDESTTVICRFPRHRSMGIATSSILVGTKADGEPSTPAIRIQGSKGEIQVMYPAFRPTVYKVIRTAKQQQPQQSQIQQPQQQGTVEMVECPIPRDPKRNWGHGFFWEADECARCIRDGKTQSQGLPWSESIAIMDTMESALKQAGISYPELITTDVFDEQSPLNTGRR